MSTHGVLAGKSEGENRCGPTANPRLVPERGLAAAKSMELLLQMVVSFPVCHGFQRDGSTMRQNAPPLEAVSERVEPFLPEKVGTQLTRLAAVAALFELDAITAANRATPQRNQRRPGRNQPIAIQSPGMQPSRQVIKTRTQRYYGTFRS